MTLYFASLRLGLSEPLPGYLFQKDGTVDQIGGSALQKSGLDLVGFCRFQGA